MFLCLLLYNVRHFELDISITDWPAQVQIYIEFSSHNNFEKLLDLPFPPQSIWSSNVASSQTQFHFRPISVKNVKEKVHFKYFVYKVISDVKLHKIEILLPGLSYSS